MIKELIKAITNRIKPCEHNFRLEISTDVIDTFGGGKWHKRVYMCTKCGIQRTISSK